MPDQDNDDDTAVRKDFRQLVNMTPAALERWLATEESRAVGWKGEDGDGAGESVGHASGKRIIAIKRKKVADLTATDIAHMRKVVGYIRRHSAQRPAKVEGSRWAASLKNWGHDPAKA